jgi:hypothetical protein
VNSVIESIMVAVLCALLRGRNKADREEDDQNAGVCLCWDKKKKREKK